jgi:aldose 1-epimerase
VTVPCASTWPLRPDNIPTGEVVPVGGVFDLRRPTRIGRQFYDHVWTGVIAQEGWSTAVFEDPEAKVRIRVEADGSFREWVLYAPEARPVVCFEPYTSTTNAHNLQARGVDAGLIVLEPGQTLKGTMRFVPEIRSNHE